MERAKGLTGRVRRTATDRRRCEHNGLRCRAKTSRLVAVLLVTGSIAVGTVSAQSTEPPTQSDQSSFDADAFFGGSGPAVESPDSAADETPSTTDDTTESEQATPESTGGEPATPPENERPTEGDGEGTETAEPVGTFSFDAADLFSGELIRDLSDTSIGDAAGMESALLVRQEVVRIGGSFSMGISGSYRYPTPPVQGGAPYLGSLRFSTGGSLVLDARPDESFRFYLDTRFAYDEEIDDWVFSVQEAFGDVQAGDKLFIRAGKHEIHWGPGRVYNPADVLSLTPIDPDDPEADREGPLSVRFHIPWIDKNVYAYLIAQDVADVSDVGVAARGEIVVGVTELSLGGFYRYGLAPRIISTATFGLLGMDWYAEGVAAWGSDRRYVSADTEGVLSTYRVTDQPFFEATVGTSLSLSNLIETQQRVTLSGQYLYNGTGYAGTGASVLTAQTDAVAELVTSGAIVDDDLRMPGRHYATASLSWRDILGSGVSLTGSWNGNLADGSGSIRGSASYTLWEDVGLTVSPSYTFAYGATGTEFATPQPSMFSVNVSMSAGSGRF